MTTYTFDSRFDYRITAKDNAFVTWSKYTGLSSNTGGVFPEFIGNVGDQAYLITADEAHVFSPTITNEFIFSTGSGALVTLAPSEVSYLNSPANPLNKVFGNTGVEGNAGILAVNINGYATPGFNEYFRAENDSLQFSDNVNWVHGRNSMTFGFNYIKKKEVDFDNVRFVDFGCTGAYCGNGRDSFTSSGSDLGQVGGDGFADVLLGKPKVIHQRYSYTGSGPFAPEPTELIPYYGIYFNDKIQFTPRLTISLGLRYDLPVPLYTSDRYGNAIYRPATDDLAIPGRAPGLPLHYISTPKSDVAPRFSAAFQARPRLVLRAGYGLYYDSGASQISNSLGTAGGNVPGAFVGDEVTPTSLGGNDEDPITSLSQVFQASPAIVLGTYPVSTGLAQGYFGDGQYTTLYENDINQSVSTPYFHRYLADIQQELSPNSVFTLSYIGALGRNGWFYKDLNVPAYQTGYPDQNTFNAARPYNSGRFGDIYAQRAGLNSNYNAGIVKYEQRMNHGVQILTHYTFAKTISDRGLNGQFTSLGYNYPQSVLRYRGEATLSHRHRFLFQANYMPDYARHLPSYLRPALGDWHISAIGTYESGDALTVTDQNNLAQDYAASFGTPNVLHNPNLGRSQRTYTQYFDVNAFVEAPANVRGTASPGSVRGPGRRIGTSPLAKTSPSMNGCTRKFVRTCSTRSITPSGTAWIQP